MKALKIYLIPCLFITVLLSSCARRDMPQADFGNFTVERADSVLEYVNGAYTYRFYDNQHKVTYVVYSEKRMNLKVGQTIPGLIRK